MRLFRLLVVVTLVTLCGGAFGTAVGALVGFATPNALEVFFDVELENTSDDADAARAADSTGATVAVSASGEKSFTVYGASLGASFGLVSGAMIALVIGVLDQLILALLHFRRPNGQAPQTS
ncbi:MAG: hypothetical protein AAF333_06735 [Planctomycetota bacterium]